MSPGILAESFVNRFGHEITAVVTVALVVLAVYLVERAFRRRGRRLAERMAGGRLDAVIETRLRFVRRLVQAAIVVIGLATAISQFGALDRLAASILASGAIAAATVGFAARQVLANVVAGVMLAVTQPIRIGDLVTLDDGSGVVEDIRLTYTFLRTPSGSRLIVPNERLAGSVMRNDSIVSDTVSVEARVWLPADADERRAIAAIEGALDGVSVSVAEVAADGVALSVGGAPVTVAQRPGREAELRAAALAALRAEGLR